MILAEATSKEFMSSREQAVKNMLLNLLKDDGRGHKFPAFAERLKRFSLHIIYNDPEYTASVSWDEGIIRLNNGFLQPDEDGKLHMFQQLSVLLRHELSHNLLMHQIRMLNELTKEYGKEATDHISTSSTWHDIENWLMDFEISNKVYDGGKNFDAKFAKKHVKDSDKAIVRNMKLFGRVIGGLVTEDYRAWDKMSLEEMYHALEAEIFKITSDLKNQFALKEKRNALGLNYSSNGLTNKILDLFYYAEPTNKNNYLGSIDDFMQNKAYFHFFPQGNVIATLDRLPNQWQTVIKDAYKYLSNAKLKTKAVKDLLDTIIASEPIAPVQLMTEDGKAFCTLYNPEEKLFVSDMIRYYLDDDYYLSDYEKWYNKVYKVFSENNYTEDDMKKILAGIK